jgi:hypothetical protein
MLPVLLRDSKYTVLEVRDGCLKLSSVHFPTKFPRKRSYYVQTGTLYLLTVLSLAGQASRCASVPQFVPPTIAKTQACGTWRVP